MSAGVLIGKTVSESEEAAGGCGKGERERGLPAGGEIAEAPEEMAAFFERRLEIYEEHQLREIQGAFEFYERTAELLPAQTGARILDLGCGTGLELKFYYARNPGARVTCIDLSEKMLEALQKNFSKYKPCIVCGDYFKTDLGEKDFDAAVSVESMHHFTYAEKVPLYRKIRAALRGEGRFVLTDYLEDDDAAERAGFAAQERKLAEYGLKDGGFYHIDTPLTVKHELQALREAGFSHAEECGRWNKTSILLAKR